MRICGAGVLRGVAGVLPCLASAPAGVNEPARARGSVPPAGLPARRVADRVAFADLSGSTLPLGLGWRAWCCISARACVCAIVRVVEKCWRLVKPSFLAAAGFPAWFLLLHGFAFLVAVRGFAFKAPLVKDSLLSKAIPLSLSSTRSLLSRRGPGCSGLAHGAARVV
eukprot:scaffold20629_cov67-Phaeocystis_antarctica.AAC.5